jgi:16S rRNA G966 N2-methylase RsmD
MKTRTKPKKYQPVLDLPPLSAEEHDGLKASIDLHGVLVPIMLAEDGRVIDGSNRKRIADGLGVECPEVVQAGLDEEEIRALARSLNIARRQLSREQRRQLVADQLRETPGWSNRRVAKALGVDHHTVASVRLELEPTGEIPQFTRTTGLDGKARPATRPATVVHRSPQERQARTDATTLLHGDCREVLTTLPTASVDLVLCDPPYPEVDRGYGRVSEADWHSLMRDVVRECRRVLKPRGSMVVLLQPNYEKIGRMRLWSYEYVLWAAREWNLVQDLYLHVPDALPSAGTSRGEGLLKTSVKWLVWLGPVDCYRNQEAVLRTPSEPVTTRQRPDDPRGSPSGRTRRMGRMHRTALERGGSVPPNCLVIPKGGGSPGSEGHPAVTPMALCEWLCRYLLPEKGVMLDPFCGSGTMLLAALEQGASRVIGIDREEKYLAIAKRRIETS